MKGRRMSETQKRFKGAKDRCGIAIWKDAKRMVDELHELTGDTAIDIASACIRGEYGRRKRRKGKR